VHILEDPKIIQERSKWGWLYEKIMALHQNKIPELEDEVLWEYLELKQRRLSTNLVGKQLKAMNITSKPGRPGHKVYEIDKFDLEYKADVKEYFLV